MEELLPGLNFFGNERIGDDIAITLIILTYFEIHKNIA